MQQLEYTIPLYSRQWPPNTANDTPSKKPFKLKVMATNEKEECYQDSGYVVPWLGYGSLELWNVNKKVSLVPPFSVPTRGNIFYSKIGSICKIEMIFFICYHPNWIQTLLHDY